MTTTLPLPHPRPLGRLLALAATALLVGCGGGANGTLDAKVEVRGRIALAALDGATVRVYRLGDYETPLATVPTLPGATLAEHGRFTCALPRSTGGAMYLLVAGGGLAYDVNEDGIANEATWNGGTVHALASAADFQRGEVLLSAVTEVVYQRVRYFLAARYDDAYVAKACDAWASLVLRANVAGGPGIDNQDALAFDPRRHAAATFRRYDPHFLDFEDTLIDGPNPTEKAFALSREQIHFENLPGEGHGVALVGDVAYLCRGPAGLEMRDVSDPTDAPLLATYDTPGSALEVQVVGTLAYVADGAGGLLILDVSHPTPTFVGSLALAPGPVVAVRVVGNLAYVCTAPNAGPALAIVDVTNPASPTLLSTFGTDDFPRRVCVEGGYAYVMEQNRVETFDVTDPLQPVYRGVLHTTTSARIDVAQGHLYLADDTHLEVFSLAAPATPTSVGSVLVPGYDSRSIHVVGTRALLTRGQSGLALVDVADPAQPRYLGSIASSGSSEDAAVSGGLCVVSERYGGLSTLALGTPPPSGVVGSYPGLGGVDSVKAVGNRLYAATNNPSELVVFDVTNPLVPDRLGSVPLASDSGVDIAVDGGTAFVAERGGLQAYDVTRADAPAFVGGVTTVTAIQGLAAGQGVVYTVNGSEVGVYDVTTPSNIGTLPSLPLTGTGERADHEAGVLAVAAGLQGLVLYDTLTPTAPVKVGTLAASFAMDVTLRLPYAFVSLYDGTDISQVLRIADVSFPTTPTSVRNVVLPGMVDRLDHAGNFVYASAWVAGVNVVDATQPNAAFHMGTIPVPGNIRDLDVEGDYVYVADGFPAGAVLVLRAAQVAVP